MSSIKRVLPRVALSYFFLLFLAGANVFAATPITTADELLAVTTDSGGDRVLNAGDYQIAAGSAINFSAYPFVINNAASILTANNAGASGMLLQVDRLSVGPGTLTATGGSGSSSYGVNARNGFALIGGSVTATGGTGSLSYGINVAAGGMQMSDGSLTATAGRGFGINIAAGGLRVTGGILNANGSATNANTAGVRVINGGFLQSDGTINANASTTAGINQGYGIWITGTGSYVQSGGTLNATGGSGSQNYGVYTQNSVTIENTAILTAAGGTGSNAAGFLVYGNVTQNGGTIDLTAGRGFYANGMYLTGTAAYTQNDGSVKASGGAGNDAFGLAAASYTQTGGTLEARGSDTSRGRGVQINGAFTQKNGSVTATGGANSDANYASIALFATTFTQDNGTNTFTGGSGVNSRGLYTSSFTMKDGTTTATAGGADRTYGLQASTFSQSGGKIVARGAVGTAADSTSGVFSNEYTLTDGELDAEGGSGTNSHGLRTGNLTQAAGAITARGGVGTNSHGIFVDTMTKNGGTFAATGGSGAGSRGVYADTFTLDGTDITATAGSANDTNGLYAATLVHNGGVITARGAAGSATTATSGVYTENYELHTGTLDAEGGSGTNSHGFMANTMTKSGGILTATGGSGAGSRGVYATTFTLDVTDITATAGSANDTNGLYTATLVHNGGVITARGAAGSATTATSGVYAGSYELHTGTLDAEGGSGTNSHGFMANAMTKSGGILTATGGSGAGSRGVYATTFTLAGDFTATAGTEADADGIYAATLNQDGGTITAQGGSAVASGSASGVAAGIYNMRGGALNATGGGGSNSRGMTAGTVAQSAGSVLAAGGAATGAYGMFVNNYTQTAGTLTARSGVADGVFVTTSMDIDHDLRIERQEQGQGASVYLGNTAEMRLGSSSVLTPVVDVAVLESPNPNLATGIIQSNGGRLVIDSGARVTPFFVDTRNMTRGVHYINVPFIDLGGGVIDGDFVDSNVRRGYFITYTLQKLGNDQYVFRVEREGDITPEIPEIPCENSKRIIGIIDGLLTRNPRIAALNYTWDVLENSQDRADWIARAAHVGKTMMPQAYMKYTHSLIRIADLTQTDFSRQLGAFSRWHGAARAASENAVPSLAAAPRDWTMWASPLFQQSSRFKTTCYEFEDAKEKHYGFSAGAAKRLGALTLGASVHYLRGKYEAANTDLDSDNLGFVLGGRLDALVPSGGWFDPSVNFSVSYTYSDIDQKNMGYDYLWRKSSPHAGTYRGSMALANRVALGGRFAVTPFVGADYTHVKQSGYRDRGDSAYLFSVSGASYNSLRPGAGLEVEVGVTSRLTATARGQWRYETMDRRSSFYTRSASFDGLAFTAEGEDRKRASGTVGAGLRYAIGERVAATLNYDVVLEDKYAAHRFEAGIGFAF